MSFTSEDLTDFELVTKWYKEPSTRTKRNSSMSAMKRPYQMVTWTDLARNGKFYADELERGERFIIIKNGKPFATVEPISETLTTKVRIDP